MCEFHNSNSNGLGDIWWTDKCSYFSSIDGVGVDRGRPGIMEQFFSQSSITYLSK